MSGTTLQLGDGFPRFRPELSPQVKDLQHLLRRWGYPIGATGHYDWPTASAVVHFQRAMGLSADGKVVVGGGRTWPMLEGPAPATPPGRSFPSVDLYPVPFIDQFDPIFVRGAGETGCFAASETMLRAVGVRQAGFANRFQVITKETWERSKPKHTIDDVALKDGLVYLDAQLARGIPVMVGVSYAEGSYNEGITEHFVVIYEKEEKEGGYRFHDPATTTKSMGAGRQFTVDSTTKNLTAAGIPGQEGYAVGARYYVTMIRKNEE
jgi:peptidoglycan hydrolase-like protein with peptidoglycan-binding domain